MANEILDGANYDWRYQKRVTQIWSMCQSHLTALFDSITCIALSEKQLIPHLGQYLFQRTVLLAHQPIEPISLFGWNGQFTNRVDIEQRHQQVLFISSQSASSKPACVFKSSSWPDSQSSGFWHEGDSDKSLADSSWLWQNVVWISIWYSFFQNVDILYRGCQMEIQLATKFYQRGVKSLPTLYSYLSFWWKLASTPYGAYLQAEAL